MAIFSRCLIVSILFWANLVTAQNHSNTKSFPEMTQNTDDSSSYFSSTPDSPSPGEPIHAVFTVSMDRPNFNIARISLRKNGPNGDVIPLWF